MHWNHSIGGNHTTSCFLVLWFLFWFFIYFFVNLYIELKKNQFHSIKSKDRGPNKEHYESGSSGQIHQITKARDLNMNVYIFCCCFISQKEKKNISQKIVGENVSVYGISTLFFTNFLKLYYSTRLTFSRLSLNKLFPLVTNSSCNPATVDHVFSREFHVKIAS